MIALSQSDFLQALGWAVMNSLWQMALLWIVYQLITAVLQLQKSAQRATLASSLLFAGFTWFVFTFLVVLDKNSGAAGQFTLISVVSENETLSQWFRTGLPWASMVYLILLILPVLNFVRNYRYVQHIRHHGISKAGVEWRMFVQKVSGHLGVRKPVQIWISELVNSPVTIGYLKPVILLPMAAVNQLTSQQLEAILLHELSHIRRMDYLTNLITRVIQTVLYFNPFVKAFSRIIDREREKSCDEMVMQFQYEPHGYASALLVLEQSSRNSASRMLAMAAAGGKKNQLLHRVESILGIKKKEPFSFYKLAGVLSAVVCLIALNALVIISKPVKSKSAPGFFLSQLSSPMSFVPGDNTYSEIPVMEELPGEILANVKADDEHSAVARDARKAEEAVADEPSVAPLTAQAVNPAVDDEFIRKTVENATSHFKMVSNFETVVPELTAQQEDQVKKALDASKKVLEETQWKVLEKNIADAMTIAEKEKVKAAYEKVTAETQKANWDKMSDNLKIAYDQIDWENLNAQLNFAVNNIRLDSLRQVYSIAMTELSGLSTEMKKQGLKGIPDSDITLDAIQKKMKDLQKARTTLQAIKTKKIINL
ncbi:M48 family metalloprotease [Terrimonas sp. NA20]|uniref:M48 family metalloprotease n=1 Tax=Terrimonas ginsenosidimutans TaxID=2908004 RepID=A0ABS9KYG0_9BACT|nr:M56 family metallopeptidase [Terrimonas ginsenosidimutans]MCG2617355.1 M48 family metalloprotease [Terrimonas ginsenosidimutans]